MKRFLTCSFIFASAAIVFACSSSDSGNTNKAADTTTPTDTEDSGTTPGEQTDGGATTADTGPAEGTEDPSGNPILLGAPRVVRTFTPPGGSPYFVDGVAWSSVRSQLFVALPFAANLAGGKGILTTFKADGTNYTELRAGDKLATGVIGNSIDKQGNLISAELKSVTRTVITASGVGAVTTIASGYGVPDPDGGAVGTPFDTPNDLVALDDGTIFVTDPGYEVTPRPDVGHLIKISPAGVATVAAAYDFNPSPNGIALTKDQGTLYVGFTAPAAGTPPFVRKYTISADRTLVDGGKLFEMPIDSNPDGLAVDDSGNIYVAMKTGIGVFKPTGEPYGGAQAKIPQTLIDDGGPTSLTFGGADRKSLFVTVQGGKVFELKTKVAGLLQ